MDALHNDDNRACTLVVETRQQRVYEPLIGGRALRFRKGVIRFQRIVDNDDIAAAAGQGAADRCREAEPAFCELNLSFRVLVRPDAGIWERSSIPGRLDQSAKIIAVLSG